MSMRGLRAQRWVMLVVTTLHPRPAHVQELHWSPHQMVAQDIALTASSRHSSISSGRCVCMYVCEPVRWVHLA